MDGADGTRDLFALFDLPETYEVDAAALGQRYHALQQRLHPDRFAGAAESERRMSVQRAAEINDAFQTLKDPLRRARYLLARAGIATDDETDTVMDPEFLMRQLEWREQLESVRAAPPATRPRALQGLAQEVGAQMREREQMFALALQQDLKKARTVVREMQFLRKLTVEVDALAEREDF